MKTRDNNSGKFNLKVELSFPFQVRKLNCVSYSKYKTILYTSYLHYTIFY